MRRRKREFLPLIVFWGVWSQYHGVFEKIGYAIKLNIVMLEWSSTQLWSPYAIFRLVPDLEEAVPGPCCHCHAVVGHTQAAHPVIMTSQDTCTVSLQSVPDIAVKIVVTGQQ